MASSLVLNTGCLEYMKSLPDNYFDLAVADPPYGDGSSQTVNVERERERRSKQPLRFHGGDRWNKYLPNNEGGVAREGQVSPRLVERTGGQWAAKYGKKIIAWDVAPEKEYFDELFRVSRNQVIWGGNYFDLPPTRCFLVWRKTNIPLEGFTMAPIEYAWTSFNRNAMMFEHTSQGKPSEPRIHVCQKPVELYVWIYKNFAKQGDKIFDPYLGSGSSRIAAYDMGLDFVGCEIDEVYFKLQEERFEQYTAQTSLFT